MMHISQLFLSTDSDDDFYFFESGVYNNNTLENSSESQESLEDIEQAKLTSQPDSVAEQSSEIVIPDFSVQSLMVTTKTLFGAALPFCASRFAVSVQGIGYAYLMGQFGRSAISAGPLISGLQNAVVTPLRSGLGAINVLVPSMNQPRRIGRLVQQTYASTLLLTLPTLAILLNAGAMLRGMGTDPAVAAEVSSYMHGYAWGILPIYGLVIDQQFCLAIGKRGVATLIGLIYATMVLVSGYVLTTYASPDLYHNTYGLGLGFSVSAWLMSLALKVFFMIHPDYKTYQLFHFKDFFKHIRKNMSSMMKISVPMWLQSISESFNLMTISVLMSRINNEALMAEQVSLQWMTAFSPVILAIANVTCSITSRLYGKLMQPMTPGQHQPGPQILQQLGRQTLASIILASGIGAILASLFLTIPRALTSLFVPASGDPTQDQAIESLSATMLHTNSIGVLADSLRITLTGNLLGMRDALVPAAVSFLLISGLGLLVGAVGTEIFGFGGDTLFRVRNLFIVAATLAISARWFIYRDNLNNTASSGFSELDCADVAVGTNGGSPSAYVPSPTNGGLTQYGSFFATGTVLSVGCAAGKSRSDALSLHPIAR